MKDFFGIFSALKGVLEIIDKWFTKTPEEKVKDEIERLQENSKEIGDAINKAKDGKTSDLERLLNK